MLDRRGEGKLKAGTHGSPGDPTRPGFTSSPQGALSSTVHCLDGFPATSAFISRAWSRVESASHPRDDALGVAALGDPPYVHQAADGSHIRCNPHQGTREKSENGFSPLCCNKQPSAADGCCCIFLVF